MQRPFTSFPDGWPGVGLMLLRCSLAFELGGRVLQRLFVSASEPAIIHTPDWGVFLIAASLCLGVLTPLAAIAGGVFALASPLVPAIACYCHDNWEIVHVVVFAISVALVGPGAYSIDGRLFGRREIIVPRIPLSGGDQ